MNTSSPPDCHHDSVPVQLPYSDGRPSFEKASSVVRWRCVTMPIAVVCAMLFALLTPLLWSDTVLAQAPRNFRIPPYVLPDVESSETEAATLPESTSPPRKVIVDTDPGVDDAAALIWLFSQQRYEVEVLGVVTVAGNSTITNTTNNANLILEWLEEMTPLVQGASGPLQQPLSLVPWFIHGPDGLWSPLYPESTPDADPDSSDATAFYCTSLAPGVLVLTLGPLTNIALAMESCPAMWAGVEIVSLGGGKFVNNQTPVSEYNYWQDPEAAALVVSNTVSMEFLQWNQVEEPITPTLQIVLADSFTQFEIRPSLTRQMERRGVPAIQNLLPTLEFYMSLLSEQGEVPTLPDVAAVIYALDNRLGTAQSAQVEVLAGNGVPEVARGQTVIGLTPIEKVVMIAGDAGLSGLALKAFIPDPDVPEFDLMAEIGAILSSQPDNAMVVTDIDARRMRNVFLQGLRMHSTSSTSENGDVTSEMTVFENHIFVPFVSD